MPMRLLLLSVLVLPFALAAQDEEALIVGVTPSPPFSYEENGAWTGLSVELWDALADELGYRYELRPVSLSEALEGVSGGELDVVAAALVATAEREAMMDFSHSFYSSGLSVATAAEKRSIVLGFVEALFTREAFLAVGTLALVLFGVGVVIWAVERKRNPEQFGGTTAEGVGSGFWWSAVTMTTVGYGDKAPISLPGRVVGLVWMFASIIIISGFTGAIASALTVSSLEPAIEDLEDLYRARVGVVTDSAAGDFLRKQGISARPFGSTAEGLAAVATGELDGFVNDAPVLRYHVGRDHPDTLIVLDRSFEPGFYAFALEQGFPEQERLDRTLLRLLKEPLWEQIRQRHLGE